MARSKHASVSPLLTADTARDFLDRLATDPAFYDAVARDPINELAKIGIDVWDDSVSPGTGVALPPQEEIQRFLGDCHDPSYLGQPGKDVLGWAILYIVLGAMPFVARDAPEGDAAG